MTSSVSFINQQIELFSNDLKNHSLYEPIRYILALDAKRIRPKLLLDTVETFGGTSMEAMPLALAIEVFHNFTLLHDDIMDNSSLRRGKPTVHEKWNTNTAILSGDAMMILAYQQINKLPEKHQPIILKKFNDMALKLCEGQQDDMDFENHDVVNIEQYIQMIKNKTSVLLAFSLEAGAILSNQDEQTQKLMHDFGINLGIAFQLQDDLLDLYPKSHEMGKEVGGDIKNKKKALPLLIALNQEELREDVIQLIQHQSGNTVPEVIKLFNQQNVPQHCESLIEDYYQKAKNNLMQIKGVDTKIFFDFCNALQNRVK